jgi:hypothetical protein
VIEYWNVIVQVLPVLEISQGSQGTIRSKCWITVVRASFNA